MGTCLEWVDRLKREALSLLAMELGGQDGREPEDSQGPARAGVPRNVDRVEEPGVPEDVTVVRAPEEAPRRAEGPGVSSDVHFSSVPEGARRVVRPRVSRYVDIGKVSEEDQAEIKEERRRETVELMLQVRESETGEESGLSGEVSEKEVLDGSAPPERPKKKWKYRQHDLEEQPGGQQEQGRDSRQPSQDQDQNLEANAEGTEQQSRSKIGARKSLTSSLLGRRKSQGKYRLEKQPSVRSRPESLASSLASRPSVLPRSSLAHRSSFTLRSSQTPRVSLVPRVSLGPQVALEAHPSDLRKESSLYSLGSELKSRRQTIRFSLLPKSSRRLSQRSAGPCVSLISAFNELAKLGDPDLLEMVEQEGRTAGGR